MAVAEVQRGVRRQRVEVAPPAVVGDPRALGVGDRDRQRVVVVGGVAVGDRGRVLRAEAHVERERQAARPAAGLEELRDVDDDGLEAAGAQLALQPRRAGGHDDRAPDDDGVRAERVGLVVRQRDRVGDELGDEPRAVGVERGRRVHRGARVERAEDDVDVVEARVAELDRAGSRRRRSARDRRRRSRRSARGSPRRACRRTAARRPRPPARRPRRACGSRSRARGTSARRARSPGGARGGACGPG